MTDARDLVLRPETSLVTRQRTLARRVMSELFPRPRVGIDPGLEPGDDRSLGVFVALRRKLAGWDVARLPDDWDPADVVDAVDVVVTRSLDTVAMCAEQNVPTVLAVEYFDYGSFQANAYLTETCFAWERGATQCQPFVSDQKSVFDWDWVGEAIPVALAMSREPRPVKRRRCIFWVGHEQEYFPDRQRLASEYDADIRFRTTDGDLAREMIVDHAKEIDLLVCVDDLDNRSTAKILNIVAPLLRGHIPVVFLASDRRLAFNRSQFGVWSDLTSEAFACVQGCSRPPEIRDTLTRCLRVRDAMLEVQQIAELDSA